MKLLKKLCSLLSTYELAILKRQLLEYNRDTFDRFMQDLTKTHKKQIEIGLDFAENENNLKKFYDFAGPDFSWPSKMNIYDRYEIFDYIIDPRWEVGKEIATNTIAYNRFIEFGAFDNSKGTHVLIVNGQIKEYYKKDISSEKYEELDKKYPGMYFAPITDEETVLLCRFSDNNDITAKE